MTDIKFTHRAKWDIYHLNKPIILKDEFVAIIHAEGPSLIVKGFSGQSVSVSEYFVEKLDNKALNYCDIGHWIEGTSKHNISYNDLSKYEISSKIPRNSRRVVVSEG